VNTMTVALLYSDFFSCRVYGAGSQIHQVERMLGDLEQCAEENNG
jgi:hypothetical protein